MFEIVGGSWELRVMIRSVHEILFGGGEVGWMEEAGKTSKFRLLRMVDCKTK